MCSTCPNPPAGPRRRCGCGPQDPASTSTSAGGPTCDASTSNTPSGSSRTPWAGQHPHCAPPNKPTAGPGSSSPPTPSSASPEASSTTPGSPGNDDANPADLPPPASEGDFVDLPRHWARRPVHQSRTPGPGRPKGTRREDEPLSLIHISEPTRRTPISYAV